MRESARSGTALRNSQQQLQCRKRAFQPAMETDGEWFTGKSVVVVGRRMRTLSRNPEDLLRLLPSRSLFARAITTSVLPDGRMCEGAGRMQKSRCENEDHGRGKELREIG